MTKKDEALIEAALRLPRHSQTELVQRRLDQLDAEDAIDAGIEEAERRWQAFRLGEIRGIPAEEIFTGLRKKRKRP